MRPEDFDVLAGLLTQRSGIALTPDKQYLLETRLQPILAGLNCKTIGDLITKLKLDSKNDALIREVIEAMTTNESMFFRDIKPFEQLKKMVFPEIKNKQGTIRIWSAACSNGQEPYSIAISILEEKNNLNGAQFEILATDLDTKVIKKAQEGLYTQFEVQRGLPITTLLSNFSQEANNNWRIKDHVKSMVRFRQFNLLDSFALHGKFDIIMCRNVLIYFDDATKRDILKKLSQALQPNGYLFLGAAETIIGLSDDLKPFGNERGIYVRVNP
ncbi:MAG: protein-glutamate O-methyltransferase CheR [Rickettsiales bacterium]